jgi:hypothetical protein
MTFARKRAYYPDGNKTFGSRTLLQKRPLLSFLVRAIGSVVRTKLAPMPLEEVRHACGSLREGIAFGLLLLASGDLNTAEAAYPPGASCCCVDPTGYNNVCPFHGEKFCVNTNTDADACGSCNNSCLVGQQVCCNGKCVDLSPAVCGTSCASAAACGTAPGGKAACCLGHYADVNSDPLNCGGCTLPDLAVRLPRQVPPLRPPGHMCKVKVRI